MEAIRHAGLANRAPAYAGEGVYAAYAALFAREGRCPNWVPAFAGKQVFRGPPSEAWHP